MLVTILYSTGCSLCQKMLLSRSLNNIFIWLDTSLTLRTHVEHLTSKLKVKI